MLAIRKPSARALALTLVVASLWPGATLARAGLTLSVQPSASSVGTGSFDVTLTDTGGTYQVAFFSVELSVATNSGVLFQSAGTNTNATMDPYIFGTLQSSPFSFDHFPNTMFTASDGPQSAPGFVTLTTGQTVGLEHVTYSVAPGTPPGQVAVAIDDIGGATYLNDNQGGLISFTPVNGILTVVPEPSSLALCGIAGGAGLVLAGVRLRRRRPARASGVAR